jgi:hypothetical protein
MNNPANQPAAVLAIGIVIAAVIGSFAFYSVKSLGNTLSVTGSATATTTADAAKWTVNVARASSEEGIASAQTRVGNDAQAVVKFFAAAGIPAESTTASPIFVDREYSNDNNAPRRYNVREDVTVQSNNPRLIEKLSKDINELTARGILVSVQSPEYYVTTLPQIRIQLIGKAVADAKQRAESIAKATGQSVGRLQTASGGVVQVMAPNSVDVADYGSYDTSTIDKQVMVTAKAVFQIR